MNSGNTTFTNLTGTTTLNTNATVRGLRINSTTATGINDPAGAITGVSISEIATVTTTTGTAVLLSDTGGTILLTNVSSNGAVSGISLTNTTGSFTVTGTGTANSGGTIQNSTGNGVSLSTVTNFSLNRVNITGSADHGIGGANVNGFVLDSCSITNNGNTDLTNDSGISLTNLRGSSSSGTNPTQITNCNISNNFEFQLDIQNSTGTLTNLQMSGNTISSTGASGVAGNLFNFINIGGGASNMELNLTSGTFTGAAPNTATAIQCDNSGTGGLVRCNITGGTYVNNNVAVSVSQANGGSLKFNVSNTNSTGNRSHGLNLFVAGNPSTGTVDGNFSNNTVGTNGTPGSGSQTGFGIRVQNEGLPAGRPVNVLINGNTVQELVNFSGINVNQGITSQTTSSPTNVTITNNTIRNVSNSRAIIVQQNNANAAAGAPGLTCANVFGNEMTGISGNVADGTKIRFRQLTGGTFNVPPANIAGIASANSPPNGVATTTTTVPQVSVGGTLTFNGATCVQPSPAIETEGDDGKSTAEIQTDQSETETVDASISSETNLFSNGLASIGNAFGRVYGRVSEAISPTVKAETTNAVFSGETVNKPLGTIPAGEQVVVRFDVTIDSNIPTNDFSVSNQGTVSGSNFSNVLTDDPGVLGATNPTVTTVVHPPTIQKAFGAPFLATGGTTTLTFTIGNANPVTSFTNVAFSDTLPAGMVIATPNGLVNNCGGGTISATQGTSLFSLSALSRAANTTCTIVINVTASTEGVKNNVTSTISSTQGGVGLTGSASVTVLNAPTFTKAFGAPTIPLNASTSLSFTITNNSPTSALNGVGFTDSLPTGLVVATPPNVSGSCGGGTITANAGTGSILLAGAILATSANCTFSVDVTGTTAGLKNNSVNLATTELGANSATANAGLTVIAPPTIVKSFAPSTVLRNNSFTVMTLAITNPAANTAALNNVGVVDNFPSGMVVNITPTATNSCGTGTFSPSGGATSVTVSGATIPINTTCNFTVRITGTSEGALLNTTQNVTSSNGGNGLTASATLTVTNTAVWNGATNSDWNNGTNWTPNVPPNSGNSVDVPSTGVTNNPTISASDTTIGNLTVSSPRVLTISTGRLLTVNNACTINGTMTVAGSFSCGSFSGTGTVNFTGAAAQNIPALAFNNLTINNSSGVNLAGNVTVNGILTMTSGNISTGANVLTIGQTGTISRTAGQINGIVEKIFGATGAFNYPVGTATGFSPLAVNVTALAVNPSTLRVRANDGTAPAAPALDDALTLDRYWTLTETGDLTANLTFGYLQADVDGTETNYRTIRIAGGTATGLPNGSPCPGAGAPCVDATANTIFVGNVSAFSDWTAGDFAPVAANVTVSGRVLTAEGRAVFNAEVKMVDQQGVERVARTNSFGFYRFTDVGVGENYLMSVKHKRYEFSSQVLTLEDARDDVHFIALP